MVSSTGPLPHGLAKRLAMRGEATRKRLGLDAAVSNPASNNNSDTSNDTLKRGEEGTQKTWSRETSMTSSNAAPVPKPFGVNSLSIRLYKPPMATPSEAALPLGPPTNSRALALRGAIRHPKKQLTSPSNLPSAARLARLTSNQIYSPAIAVAETLLGSPNSRALALKHDAARNPKQQATRLRRRRSQRRPGTRPPRSPVKMYRSGDGRNDAKKAVVRHDAKHVLSVRLAYLAPPLSWGQSEPGPPVKCRWDSRTREEKIKAIASQPRIGGDIGQTQKRARQDYTQSASQSGEKGAVTTTTLTTMSSSPEDRPRKRRRVD